MAVFPRQPHRGRGAISNATGRFEPEKREAFDDGWGSLASEPPKRPETQVTTEQTRSVISTNDSPDVPFDQSVNPYRGCEHGCIYCFARPTHAYLGLSAGLDFETRIVAKPAAAQLLRRELARPSYRCQVLALGANTDPYQPIERRLGITRDILELLSGCDHPVSIVTKSHGVVRDLDILSDMASRRLATVLLSVTTLSADLARVMEPRAAAPHRRLEAIRSLTRAGVPVGVLISPIIPGLNDSELEAVVRACAEAGAVSARYLLLRLPHELRVLFDEWLSEHFPERRDRVLSLIRQIRGGRLNDPRFGSRMSGEGPFAKLLAQRFALAGRKHRLDRPLPESDLTRFRPPRQEPRGPQLPLFPG